jgi:hypothetical protein
MVQTRDALHAYSRILGDCLKRCRGKRKHWWHASLRPSLNGLSTGVVYSRSDFELELNFRESLLCGQAENGARFTEKLEGQAVPELAARVAGFLMDNGVHEKQVPDSAHGQAPSTTYPDYSPRQAAAMGSVLSGVTAAMVTLRAGIREECSPIQLWPHHFDLSMLWLPLDKVPGTDPANEEESDKQMNFGFSFGDDVVPEPYFFVTAYPLPEDMRRLPLPGGTTWRTQGFDGTFLPYRKLVESADPMAYLLSLWDGLLTAGREMMTIQPARELCDE